MRWRTGAAAVLLTVGQAFADPAGWAGLARFRGTYPASGLMKSAVVRDEVAALLSVGQRALLTKMVVSPPVSAVGGDLLAQFCMPHACGGESAILVVDPARRKMWVGFYDYGGKNFRMTWVGTDDPAYIPPAVQAQLAKIHSPF